MAEKVYYGKRIRQWKGAPEIFVIDVRPSDLISWAGVPRKAPKAMAGYQRHLDNKRSKKIAEYMESHVNHIIPGTVIVASDKGYGADQFFSISDVEVNGHAESGDPEHNLVRISFDYPFDKHEDDITTDDIKQMLDEIIEKNELRIGDMVQDGDELDSSDGVDDDSSKVEDSEDSDAENGSEDDEEKMLDMPSGFSKFVKALKDLRDSNLLDRLDEIGDVVVEDGSMKDTEWVCASCDEDIEYGQEKCLSCGAQFSWEEGSDQNAESTDEYDKVELKTWKRWIISEHKIGNIMDGQHRIFGALKTNPSNCDHLDTGDEPLCSITLIPDLPKAEQVFHFSMMNMTPVKVKAGLARSSAVHSLTPRELDIYDSRLREYMDVLAARWINKIDSSHGSPFLGMLTHDYLHNPTIGFVEEKIMNQIMKEWYNAKSSNKSYGRVFKDAAAWNSDTTKLEFRLQSFFVFWNAIAEKFPSDWADRESNLWRKISLWTLQDFLRVKMSQQMTLWVRSNSPPFNDLSSLKDFLDAILDEFPGNFYSSAWNTELLDDTTKGRARFMTLMEEQYGHDKVKRNFKLFINANKK